ncbi:MAG TPA: hypothetical protein DCR46_07480 [Cytophagales bacterium]|nr:hypothetical protein [Cytophagales bacterium]
MAKSKKEAKPRVHAELEGFDIEIDKFGQIRSNMSIEKLNEFLNKKVDDKKLRDRKDSEG